MIWLALDTLMLRPIKRSAVAKVKHNVRTIITIEHHALPLLPFRYGLWKTKHSSYRFLCILYSFSSWARIRFRHVRVPSFFYRYPLISRALTFDEKVCMFT